MEAAAGKPSLKTFPSDGDDIQNSSIDGIRSKPLILRVRVPWVYNSNAKQSATLMYRIQELCLELQPIHRDVENMKRNKYSSSIYRIKDISAEVYETVEQLTTLLKRGYTKHSFIIHRDNSGA